MFTYFFVAAALIASSITAQALPEGYAVRQMGDGGLFVPNLGQWNGKFDWKFRDGRTTVFVDTQGWTFAILESNRQSSHLSEFHRDGRSANTRAAAVSVKFVDAWKPSIIPGEKSATLHNYITGKDQKKWRTNVPTFSTISIRHVWEGIDVTLLEEGGRFRYDLALQQSANVEDVAFEVEGTGNLRLDESGSLIMETPCGTAFHPRPIAWQIMPDGSKDPVKCEFALLSQRKFGFRAPSWNRAGALIIDPSLHVASLLGGSESDSANAVDLDTQSNPVVVGHTFSTNFPTTTGAYDPTNSGTTSPVDTFVAKIDKQSGQIIHATFVGGSDYDLATSVDVDANDKITVVGFTYSNNFPTTSGAYQSNLVISQLASHNYVDAFAFRLSPDGSALDFSTYIGGAGGEWAFDVSVDGAGDSTIVGETGVPLYFPTTPGVLRPSWNSGIPDAFVLKLSSAGSNLVYSTLLGGSSQEVAYSLCIDANGNPVVVGRTDSRDFPTSNNAPDRSHNGLYDAFAAKLNTDGTAILYSTYLGGNNYENAYSVTLDGSGAAVIVGTTYSGDFPTTTGAIRTLINGNQNSANTAGASCCQGQNSYLTIFGMIVAGPLELSYSGDAFVLSLSADGTSITYGTFLGGSGKEAAFSVVVDTQNRITVAGYTDSADFPTTLGAFASQRTGVADSFLTTLTPTRDSLFASTYLGGTGSDPTYSICLRPGGGFWMAGFTDSSGFASGAVQGILSPNGGGDAFLAAFTPPPQTPTISLQIGSTIYTTNVSTLVEYGSSTVPGSFGLGVGSTDLGTILHSDTVSTGVCPTVSTITRTWTADNFGSMATLVETISVVDTTAPSVPTGGLTLSQTISLDGACQSTVPDLRETVRSVASDLATAAASLTITQTPSAGTTISGTGSVTVVVRVEDACTNASTVTFTITYVDVSAPTITAPSSLFAFATSGMCSAVGLSIGTPTVSDACGLSANPYVNNAPGSFPVGTTLVQWTATDASGNTAASLQTVSISDNQNPTITIASTDTATSDAGSCSVTAANAGIETPVASDNCGVTATSNNFGASRAVGVHTITFTATDGSGRTASATQTFTVNDSQQPSISAPADVAVTADTGICTASNVVLGTATTNDNCAVSSVNNTATSTYGLGSTTVTWTATDVNGNSSSDTQIVTVSDAQAPVVTAPASLSLAANSGTCARANPSIGTATASDNCAVSSIGSNVLASYGVGGPYTIVWTATDGSGNTHTASQSLTITDGEAPSITVVASVTAGVDLAGCLASANAVNTALGSPTLSDNCGSLSTPTASNNAAPPLAIGTYAVTWTATDGRGNTTSAVQSLSVVDATPPTVVAPPDISIGTQSGCAWTGSIGTATASDLCTVSSTIATLSGSPVGPATTFSGSTTGGGNVHLVTWTCTDASGNTSSSTQTVTVVDDDAPSVTPPSNYTVRADSVTSSRAVNYGFDGGLATSSDNCDATPSITYSPASGASFTVGTHTVTVIATDNDANTRSATFSIDMIFDWRILTSLPTGITPSDILVADVSGDGVLDVVVGGGTSLVQFLGDGTGSLTLSSSITVSGNIVAIDAGDVDGDSIVDIAAVTNLAGVCRLVVFSGTSGGLNTTPYYESALSLSQPVDVDLVAYDGLNGYSAAVVSASGSGFPITGAGTVVVRLSQSPFTATSLNANPTRGATVCDLDADGDLDVATIEAATVRFYRNGGSSFTASGTTLPPLSTTLTEITSGDLDGDGVSDDVLVGGVESGTNGSIACYLNTNSGATLASLFASPVSVSSATYASIKDLAIADLQADSVFDASTNLGLRFANDAVFINDGTGAAPDSLAAMPFNGATFGSIGASSFVNDPVALAVADLDGDGIDDVATANGDGSLRILLAQTRALGESFGTPYPVAGYSYIPSISAVSRPFQGSTASINLTGARPWTGAVLVLSPIAQLTDVSGINDGSNLYLGFPIYLLPSASGILVDGAGSAEITFSVHPTLFSGERLFFQWAVFDWGTSAGYSLSDALLLRIGK